MQSFFPLLFYKILPQYSGRYITKIRVFGRDFYVRDLTDLLVIKETFYDKCYLSLFENIDKPTTLLDLGSFIGDTTIYAGQFKAVKKIITVEPDPRNIRVLKLNLDVNRVKGVKLIEGAISNKTDYSYFNMGNESIASSLHTPKSIKEKIRVRTISLADILKMVTTPSIVMKSDCEGAEYDFFTKTSPKLLSKIDKIIFEYHMSTKKLRYVIRHLEKAGFKTTYKDLILEPNVGMAYANKIDRI